MQNYNQKKSALARIIGVVTFPAPGFPAFCTWRRMLPAHIHAAIGAKFSATTFVTITTHADITPESTFPASNEIAPGARLRVGIIQLTHLAFRHGMRGGAA